ncbi:MAG: sugar phosphate isomerase/epimerase [Clostridia bacterium]|nr:sugar phosphate isomerase/epimerase [Clostridia bacterium]
MNRKLGINADCVKDNDILENLEIIKKAGFDSIFTGTSVTDSVKDVRKKADELSLDYEFIHAPFKGINNMWIPGLDYRDIMRGMKAAIDSAAEYGVPAVVAHLSSGWKSPEITDLGLSRFDELVMYAEDKNIIIAFENLRKTGNLAYIVDRYENCENVKYCFDCGHEYCYTKSVCWPDIFTFELYCTHIHDNHSRGWAKDCNPDEHLLPFDGTYDYEKMMRKLDEYSYEGSLMLEVFRDATEDYKKLTAEQFIGTAFERLHKISEL